MRLILLIIGLLSLEVLHLEAKKIIIGAEAQYKNIQYAFDGGAIAPGDTIELEAGNFEGYQGIQNLKGTSSDWIVVKGDTNKLHEIRGTWQFISCEYIKFENLNFKANLKYPGRLIAVDNGGSCETQSRFIEFNKCKFSNVTDVNAITAFKFGGVNDFIVRNCEFRNMQNSSAFDFNVCHRGLISNNLIENCMTGGHIKGGASDITLERNLFKNSSVIPWVAFELGGDTGSQFYCPEDNFEVKNLKFYSNLIVGGYRGLSLASAVECKVVNNTFYNCEQAIMRFLTTSSLYPQMKGNIVKNNIFAFGQTAYINGSIQNSTSVEMSNNIYYSLFNPQFNGPYWDTPELDEIREIDPMIFDSNDMIFEDKESLNFKLDENSPAIGRGESVIEPEYDYYGNRFNQKRAIGAIEFISIANYEEYDTNSGIAINPNPASEYLRVVIPTEKFDLQEEKIIDIYNSLGVKLQSYYIDGNENIINTSDLPNGTYIMMSKKITKQFVILR